MAEQHVVMDCATGQQTVVPLTDAEKAARAAAAAEAEQRRQAEETWRTNEATIRSRIAAALTANKTFADAAKPGTAAAQASAAYDQAKALTRQVNGILRLLDNRLDGTD